MLLSLTPAGNPRVGRLVLGKWRKIHGGNQLDNSTKRLINSKSLNKQAVKRILGNLAPEQGIWITCPTCKKEWNKLGPTGICVECEDKCNEC